MPRVFVYPEKEWRNLGEKRWQISWEELRKSVELAPGKDIDFDADVFTVYRVFDAKSAAEAAAKKIILTGKPFFGAVSLQEQIVDWFVEEDKVAEWADVGNAEEIS